MLIEQGRRYAFFLAVLASLAFIVGALIPGAQRAAIESWLNFPFALPPVAHVVLCMLMTISLRLWRPCWHPLVALAIVLAIGGAVEIGQIWVPRRYPGWRDMGLNLVGGLLGLMAVSLSSRLFDTRFAR